MLFPEIVDACQMPLALLMSTRPENNSSIRGPVASRGFSTVKGEWAIPVILVCIAALVRLPGIFNDMWFDEVWSLNFVSTLDSPAKVFTELLHDNNHPLNSLFLYFMMPAGSDWEYRLLSWMTGSASVGVAYFIGRRQWKMFRPGTTHAHMQTAGIAAALVTGASYFFIHYSSEARGYAPAVAFCYVAILALFHGSDTGSRWWAALYSAACVLALLAHVVAIQIVIAGFAWSLLKALSGRDSIGRRARHFAAWQLAPCLFFVVYYAGFVRKVAVGGGPEYTLANVVGEAAAFVLGLPVSLGLAVALPVMFVATAGGLFLFWRERLRDVAIFYVIAILVAPALSLISSRFVFFYPRYFIVSAACAVLVVGHFGAWLWSRSGVARAVCAAAAVLFIAGNAVHLAHFFQSGRGHYQDALRYIASHSPDGVVSVSSDHDFRNYALISFYGFAGGPSHSIRYFQQDQLPPQGTHWLIVHRIDGEIPPPEVEFGTDNVFRLEKVFPFYALSGWEWYVYRNERFPLRQTAALPRQP